MSIFIRRFRSWWQPPRRAEDRPEHRQVSFLELFYDLVYVALVAELSHALSGHISWTALGAFSFLFVIVWWAWFNGSSYHDLHGNNDIRTRVFTFLQMFSVVAIAIFAQDALGESSTGFALSYAAFQLTLTYMWWRTGVHDPDHRPLSRPYARAFILSTFLFAGSVFIPVPWRFSLWGLSLAISLLLPLYTTLLLGKRDLKVRAQIDRITTISPSLVERFGLLTIIVLGEVVAGVVSGVTAHHGLNWVIGGTAALGTLIAIGLWWVYFDFVSHHIPRHSIGTVGSWYYLHLPLTIGIVAVGASILNSVEHAGEGLSLEVRWALVLATAISLVSIAALMRTTQLEHQQVRIHKVGERVMFVSAILVVLLGFIHLNTIPLLIAVAILLLMPVFFAFRVWVEGIGTDDAPDEELDIE